MEEKEIKRVNRELMASAEVVYVTTIDDESLPQTRAMFNLRSKNQFPALSHLFDDHKDDFLIYLTTNTSSDKISQIRANPAVCVYFCIPQEFRGLMLSGKIKIINDSSIRQTLWQDGWEIFYPGGPSDPDYTVLRLLPIKAKGWYKDQSFEFNLGGKK